MSGFIQQKYEYLFKILDFDHDGIISKSDLLCLAENVSIFRCLEDGSEVEQFIFDTVDSFWEDASNHVVNHNFPSCNLDAWLSFLHDRFGNHPDETVAKIVDKIFFIYDKDSDEFLSKHEYLTLFVSLRVGVKAADFCFRSLDVNHDMRISRTELGEAIHTFFLSEETNASGNLLLGNPELSRFSTQDTAPQS